MEENYVLPKLVSNKYFADNLNKDSFKNWEKLGEGAFGKVFKVEYNKKNFAIKVLSKNQLSNYKMIDQMKNEINIMLKLNHENIINLYYYFEDWKYIYLIMDLAEEGHLYSKLRKEKTFKEEKCLFYIEQLLKSLDYLHSLNPKIIHRDIKPENLLLKNNRLKLADFGWSNFNSETRNTFCGTPEYLSPEMIKGVYHNEKLDIWCAGILGYELYFGKSPFYPLKFPPESSRRQKQQLIEHNIWNNAVDFTRLSISNDLKNLFTWMLQKDQSKRPSANFLLNLPIFNKNNSKTPIIINNLTPNNLKPKNKSFNVSEKKNKSSSKNSNANKDIKNFNFQFKPTNKKVLNNENSKNSSKDKKYLEMETQISKLKKENNDLTFENKNLKGDLDMAHKELKLINNKYKKENETWLSDYYKNKHKLKECLNTINNYKNKLESLNSTIENLYKEVVYKKNLNNHTDYLNYSENESIETKENLLEEIYVYFKEIEKRKKEANEYIIYNIPGENNLKNLNKEEIINYFYTAVDYLKNKIENLEDKIKKHKDLV